MAREKDGGGSKPASRYGQFDKSFVFRVIRNYAVSALVLLILLLGLTYALFRYEFATDVPQQSQQTAESLAGDVTSIMINEGGPVASRAVYPILRRNYERLGYDIAIIPSEVTITSIQSKFGFEPKGIQPEWPDSGRFREASVSLPAQDFCLKCHVDAKPGQSLGRVQVRSYFSSYFDRWQSDATLSTVAGMANIIISTVILLCVMRILMEPVLNLKAVVSRWAKGRLSVNERIEIKSEDEFGELSHDLNLTLDRVFDILQDLRDTVYRQRHTHKSISDAIDRLEATAASVQQEARASRDLSERDPNEAIDKFKNHIERVKELRNTLEETMRSQELLIKRLE